MMDQTLKDLLDMASLYGLLAKRYEYVDPQKHMHFELLHLKYVDQLERHFKMLEKHHGPSPFSFSPPPNTMY